MGKDLKGKELGRGIIQEKSGRYLVRYVDIWGKRQAKRFNDVKSCRDWLYDMSYQDRHRDIVIPSNITVDDWYHSWIDNKKRTVRSSTFQRYESAYRNHIRPVLGNILMTDIKPIHCQEIFNRMADKGMKSSSMKAYKEVVCNFFAYAVENDVINKNPCNKLVKCNIGQDSSDRLPLTLDQQKIFLDSIKGHFFELQYKFVLQTGLRVGELIALKWEDVDFDKKCINIRRTANYMNINGLKDWVIGPPKSSAGIRTIPLTNEAIEILYKQRNRNILMKVVDLQFKDYVFLHKGHLVKQSGYDCRLITICNRAKLPKFSMHNLRHTFATRCIEAGMKPKTLQTILGHSSLSITMNRYVHTTDDEMKKEIELVEQSLSLVEMA